MPSPSLRIGCRLRDSFAIASAALVLVACGPDATSPPTLMRQDAASTNLAEVPEVPEVAAGGKSTCVRSGSEPVECWGDPYREATVPPGGPFVAITGGFYHYCGMRPDRTIECWGDGSNLVNSAPTGTFTQVSAGAEHNCALRAAGDLVCWGFGGDFRTAIPSGSYKSLGLGWYHSCAIRNDDTIACGGRNTYGQSTPPGGTFRVVQGGNSHTCAIRSDGELACFGAIVPPPPGNFVALSSGSSAAHSCAVRSTGTLACWGENSSGQASPPAGQYLQVSVGQFHSCAVRVDHAIVCWGSSGQVPPGLSSPNNPPTAVAGTDQRLTRTSPAGALATLDGSASTDVGGHIVAYDWTENGSPIAHGAAPTFLFPLGTHTVRLQVTDNKGAVATDFVTIVVSNATPVSAAGLDQVLECHAGSAMASLSGIGSTDVDGSIARYDWLLDGSVVATGTETSLPFGLGTHEITLRVTDSDGAESSDNVSVRVKDTETPTIALNVGPTVLWSPNHKMVLVASGISVMDGCDPTAALTVSVSSNEPVDAQGDGQTGSDWAVVRRPEGSYDVYVRAERAGNGNGRVYVITAVATDASGNYATATASITVPGNQK